MLNIEYINQLITEAIFNKSSIEDLSFAPDYMGYTLPAYTGVVAAYLPSQDIIFINSHLGFPNSIQMSFLVHEITHFFDYTNEYPNNRNLNLINDKLKEDGFKFKIDISKFLSAYVKSGKITMYNFEKEFGFDPFDVYKTMHLRKRMSNVYFTNRFQALKYEAHAFATQYYYFESMGGDVEDLLDGFRNIEEDLNTWINRKQTGIYAKNGGMRKHLDAVRSARRITRHDDSKRDRKKLVNKLFPMPTRGKALYNHLKRESDDDSLTQRDNKNKASILRKERYSQKYPQKLSMSKFISKKRKKFGHEEYRNKDKERENRLNFFKKS